METKQIVKDSILLNVNSNSASKYNGSMNSNLLFKTTGLIKSDKHTIYRQISLQHAEIPVSWYNINSNNNTLTITINSITTIYTITPSNYTIDSLTTYLNLIVTGMIFSFNSSTSKYTITNSLYDFVINASSSYKIFGQNKGIDLSSSSKILLFPNVVNLFSITRINIKSSIIQTKNFDTYFGQGCLLSSIPVNDAQTGLLIYHNYNNFNNLFQNPSLDYIDLQLVDEIGNLIDFNDVDIALFFQIDNYIEYIATQDNLLSLLSSNTKDKFILQKNGII